MELKMRILPKVAIQGEEGSFSEDAGIKYWDKSVVFIPKRNSDEVIEAIDDWIDSHENSEFMARALFIKAEAYFANEKYYESLLVYEELLENYGTSDHFEDAIKREVDIARRLLGGTKRIVWGFVDVSNVQLY